MSVKVDPFVVPIPRKFLEDAETRAWFEYQNQWNHDMWRRSGGGTDLVSDFSITAITGNYTTVGTEDLIIADDPLTITLNASPTDGEGFGFINNSTGYVVLDAGSKTIVGSSTYTSVVQRESFSVVYSSAYDAWFLR